MLGYFFKIKNNRNKKRDLKDPFYLQIYFILFFFTLLLRISFLSSFARQKRNSVFPPFRGGKTEILFCLAKLDKKEMVSKIANNNLKKVGRRWSIDISILGTLVRIIVCVTHRLVVELSLTNC